LNINFK